MAIIAKDDGGGFDEVPAGTYIARCFGLILLGTTYDEKYKKSRTSILVQFELPTELIESQDPKLNGMPRGLGRFYTLSLGEKSNLRADLEAWRKKPFTKEELDGFDLKNILGAPCMLTVTHNEKGKAQIKAVSAIPAGTNIVPQINPTRYFDMEDFSKWEEIPEGIRKMIKKSDEYRNLYGEGEPTIATQPPLSGEVPFDDDDTIPF